MDMVDVENYRLFLWSKVYQCFLLFCVVMLLFE